MCITEFQTNLHPMLTICSNTQHDSTILCLTFSDSVLTFE